MKFQTYDDPPTATAKVAVWGQAEMPAHRSMAVAQPQRRPWSLGLPRRWHVWRPRRWRLWEKGRGAPGASRRDDKLRSGNAEGSMG